MVEPEVVKGRVSMRVVEKISVASPELEEIRKILKVASNSGRTTHLIEEAIKKAKGLISPKGVYTLKKVLSIKDGRLYFAKGGGFKLSRQVSRGLYGSSRLVIFAVTIGDELEKEVTYLSKNGRSTEAACLDAVGSALCEEAQRALAGYILAKEASNGESLSLPFSPGYCGFDLIRQKRIFKLVDSSKIRLSLTEPSLMIPRKSISGLIGIGDFNSTPPNPCLECDAPCNSRRLKQEAF